jgi:hypothetical protein
MTRLPIAFQTPEPARQPAFSLDRSVGIPGPTGQYFSGCTSESVKGGPIIAFHGKKDL